MKGYWGALLAPDARDLSVRLPADPGGVARPRPRARRGGARTRRVARADLRPGHRPGSETRGRARRAPRRPLHVLGLRRGLAHGLRHADPGDLHPVQEPFRPGAGGNPCAAPRRAHGSRPRHRVPHPAARSPLRGARCRSAARGRSARPVGHSCAGLLRVRRRGSSSSFRQACSATGSCVVSRTSASWASRGARRCIRSRRQGWRRRRRRRSPAGRAARAALPDWRRRACSSGSRTRGTRCRVS